MPRSKDQRTSDAPIDPTTAIRIRMYDVAFGDCFLITFPTSSGPQYVLVDCGTLIGCSMDALDAAVDDIEKITEKKLALVVGTHQHYDHLSGFGRHANRFAKFKVGAVWLPWLDNPDDSRAAEWQRRQRALTAALRAHHMGLAASKEREEILRILDNNPGDTEFSVNKRELADGIDLLVGGFRGQVEPSFLRGGQQAPRIPGPLGELLSASVLGPPDSDDFLLSMTPPSPQGWGKLASTVAGMSSDPPPRPFAAVPVAEYEALHGGRKLKELRDALTSTLDSDDLQAATRNLEAARNNTSLVLSFDFGGRRMLFAGDAQWGNWERWMFGSDKAADAGTLLTTAKSILGSVNFYKVGHHGSHNATPQGALGAMPENLFAMCSTASVERYPQVPKPALMDAIKKRSGGRLARSDEPHGTLPAGFVRGDGWIELTL